MDQRSHCQRLVVSARNGAGGIGVRWTARLVHEVQWTSLQIVISGAVEVRSSRIPGATRVNWRMWARVAPEEESVNSYLPRSMRIPELLRRKCTVWQESASLYSKGEVHQESAAKCERGPTGLGPGSSQDLHLRGWLEFAPPHGSRVGFRFSEGAGGGSGRG